MARSESVEKSKSLVPLACARPSVDGGRDTNWDIGLVRRDLGMCVDDSQRFFPGSSDRELEQQVAIGVVSLLVENDVAG